jgi:hypothetical protein
MTALLIVVVGLPAAVLVYAVGIAWWVSRHPEA